MHRNPKVLLSRCATAKAEKIRIEELSTNDAVVAVIGPTGSGKSTFIEAATGITGIVGHGLASNTNEVSVIRLSFPELVDSDICFVDTPGFNHTNLLDFDVLRMIADCLNTTYRREIQLSGLLYFHDISRIPLGKSSLESLRIFERLCGNDFRRIVLATTMWDEVEEQAGTTTEESLKRVEWNSLIQRGSSVRRFMNTRDSAFEILTPIFNGVNERNTLLLQKEMIDLGLQLKETTAGRGLFIRLDYQVSRHQHLLGMIRSELKQPTLDTEHLQGLLTEYRDLSKDLQTSTVYLEKMKIWIGERIQKVFKGIDWTRFFNFFSQIRKKSPLSPEQTEIM